MFAYVLVLLIKAIARRPEGEDDEARAAARARKRVIQESQEAERARVRDCGRNGGHAFVGFYCQECGCSYAEDF